MKNSIRLCLIAALLALSTNVRADDWTLNDTLMETATLAMLAIDYHQTKQVVADGREGNPIIGLKGENISPDAYFLTVASAQLVLALVLPQPYRRISQLVVIVVQADAVSANWSAGYRMDF